MEHLKWYQMPQDGGQIVSITYAIDEYWLYCCSHDRGDNTYNIERALWNQRARECNQRFEPWNGILPSLSGVWKPV